MDSIDLVEFTTNSQIRLGTGVQTYTIVLNSRCRAKGPWLTGITLRADHDPKMNDAIKEAFEANGVFAVKDGLIRKGRPAIFLIGDTEWPTAPIITISAREPTVLRSQRR